VPGVVPHHDLGAGAGSLRLQVRGEPGCGADHHGPVHPVGTRAERATETRGAELETAVEAVRQVGSRCARGVGGDLVDQRLELGAGLVVGILG
jgi:hypothetical protein